MNALSVLGAIAPQTLAPDTLAQTTLAQTTLAWKPFLQPAPGVEHWWWVLVIPTAVGVALAYKSTRTRELSLLPRDVLRMSAQIVLAMIGIALFLYLLVIVLLPRLPVE